MAPQILCCCEIRGAVIDEWLFLTWPYCRLSKFGKMYQIYRLKSVLNDLDEKLHKTTELMLERFLGGFNIRLLTKQHVRTLVKGEGFEILDIKEICEEPVTLYLVSTRKT